MATGRRSVTPGFAVDAPLDGSFTNRPEVSVVFPDAEALVAGWEARSYRNPPSENSASGVVAATFVFGDVGERADGESDVWGGVRG